jgi:hypothetical protein
MLKSPQQLVNNITFLEKNPFGMHATAESDSKILFTLSAKER